MVNVCYYDENVDYDIFIKPQKVRAFSISSNFFLFILKKVLTMSKVPVIIVFALEENRKF